MSSGIWTNNFRNYYDWQHNYAKNKVHNIARKPAAGNNKCGPPRKPSLPKRVRMLECWLQYLFFFSQDVQESTSISHKLCNCAIFTKKKDRTNTITETLKNLGNSSRWSFSTSASIKSCHSCVRFSFQMPSS